MAAGEDPFVDYYARQTATPQTLQHFVRLRDLLLLVLNRSSREKPVTVADLGCGAGTFSRIWDEAGCPVRGIESIPRVSDIARVRTGGGDETIDFSVGSAAALPWSDASYDIVVMPEFLEHVPEWRRCLREAARILRSVGIHCASTTNLFCPVRRECTLPLYSWYRAPLKRYCVGLALTR